MSPGRKLLLAERHGWLPQDQQLLDPTLHEAADLLSAARSEVKKRMEEPTADLNKIAADFAAEAMNAVGMLQGKDYQVALPEERRGSLRHEVWEGVPGSDLKSLTSHTKFKSGDPDFAGYLGATQSPTNVGDDFGRKISGILTPPEDGVYRFWLYADDQCILKLNDAGENPDRAKEILRIPNYSPADWGQALESQPVSLRKDRDTTSRFCTRKAAETIFAPWDGPCRTALSNAPFPGSVSSYPTSIGRKLFRFVKEHEQGACRGAQALRKGKGDTADSDMRKALSDLVDKCLSFEDNFRETFDLYAEEQAVENSELISGALNDFDSSDRWKRATRLLTERQDSVLRELKDTHVIEVRSLSGMEADQVWENATEAEPPDDFGKSPLARITDLASGILSAVKADEDQDENELRGKSRSAAVILSDGLHNKGSSPFETAKLLAGRIFPFTPLASEVRRLPRRCRFGRATRHDSETDRAHGIITLKDNLDLGTDFRIVWKMSKATRFGTTTSLG